MGDLSNGFVLTLIADMLWTGILLAAPLIAITTVVGLAVSILQVVTQIQESSLTFVPKLIAATVSLLLFGSWMMLTLGQFAEQLIGRIPDYF